MCGRFARYSSTEELIASIYGGLPNIQREMFPKNCYPGRNIPPTTAVLTVAQASGKAPEFMMMGWGLILHKAKSIPKVCPHNSRDDKILTNMFRPYLDAQRCLVLADGFYEWFYPNGKRKPSIPHLFTMASGKPFCMAGVFSIPTLNGIPEPTCSIITTNVNATVKPFHDRMPVILNPQDYARWIDPTIKSALDVFDLLKPYPAEEMAVRAVDKLVRDTVIRDISENSFI